MTTNYLKSMRSYSPVQTFVEIKPVHKLDVVQIRFYETSSWLVQFWKAETYPPNVKTDRGPYLTFKNPDGNTIFGYEGDFVIRDGDTYSLYAIREFFDNFEAYED